MLPATRPCLLVDDDPGFAAMLALHLEDAGFSVAAAAGCREARSLLPRQAFDLVLLDYRLPDGTGLDLMPAVRAHQADAPVVLISGQLDSGLRAAATRDGVTAVLSKPLARTDLDALVERLVLPRATPRHSRGGDPRSAT